MMFDTKKAYDMIGPANDKDLYVKQGNHLYCWSESHCNYEVAWWLYTAKATEHTRNILIDRPFPQEHFDKLPSFSFLGRREPWMDDENVAPPYPLLRCPRCKSIFSDHEIHLCKTVEHGEDPIRSTTDKDV